MPGTRWLSFRQGNRSEYLALYILSALGIVVKVPIEEDVGADFHCSLAKVDKNKMTFQTPFIVQVKSTLENIIYGGLNIDGTWKKDEVEWLFNQELPLLIGIADKTNGKLDLFTTSNMWAARYYSGNNAQVIFQPNNPSKAHEEIKIPKSVLISEWPETTGDRKRWEIPLGPPLVSINIEEIEDTDKINLYRDILLRALRMEQENITYRRLQVHFSKWPLKITTNKYENFIYGAFIAANPVPGKNTAEQLKSLSPIIATLAFNFKSQYKLSEIQKLKPIVNLVPESVELKILKDKVPELFD